MTQRPSPVVLISGPTASGKTAVALALASLTHCRLISVDSSQIYRGMDIGSAKPSADEQQASPHHLIDIREPEETYSVAGFIADASDQIRLARAEGALPVLVGGTMLYFNALLNGLAAMPDANPAIRAAIEARAASIGWDGLHQELSGIDAVAASRIHPNDPQRIQRALEVFEITGIPISQLQQERVALLAEQPVVNATLYPAERKWLHERINARFDDMLSSGFIEEVKTLRKRSGLTGSHSSMRSVGYRQVWQYLDGEFDQLALKERGKAATRQLAKRQLTWIRSMPDAIRFDCQSLNPATIATVILEKSLAL